MKQFTTCLNTGFVPVIIHWYYGKYIYQEYAQHFINIMLARRDLLNSLTEQRTKYRRPRRPKAGPAGENV
jgi:hypothetical protein